MVVWRLEFTSPKPLILEPFLQPLSIMDKFFLGLNNNLYLVTGAHDYINALVHGSLASWIPVPQTSIPDASPSAAQSYQTLTLRPDVEGPLLTFSPPKSLVHGYRYFSPW